MSCCRCRTGARPRDRGGARTRGGGAAARGRRGGARARGDELRRARAQDNCAIQRDAPRRAAGPPRAPDWRPKRSRLHQPRRRSLLAGQVPGGAAALKIPPIQPTTAPSNLGAVYFAAGKYDDSARMYEKALQLNDTDSRIWQSAASAYLGARTEERHAPPTSAQRNDGAGAQDQPARQRQEAGLADCYSVLGHPARARDLLSRI